MIKANEITFRNLITWDKGSGQGQMSSEFRMYPIADEKCLFVMCGVQGFNTNKDNYFEGWESVRSYLANEAKKAGIGSKEVKEICGCGMYAHWFTKSQWVFLTEEHYLKLQSYCKANGIEAFKREYEEVKREYYATRAYFDNTHDNQNNVWHFNKLTGNSEERELTGGHATPKPIALCSRAIKSSSREGEIVLDVFGGSGSTLIACEQLNRRCFMMELDPKYCDVIIKRWESFTGEKAVLLND
jgi:adenine specific DNA methylase Mod